MITHTSYAIFDKTAISVDGTDKELILECTYLEYMVGMIAYHRDDKSVDEAFSFLHTDERSFLTTGVTPDAYKEMYGNC